MGRFMSSSRPWWGKQYGHINAQQQKTLVGQAVWTYQCPAAENLGGASSMDISMPSSITLVGQAVWTYQCPAADFWWGKQYGHFNVQQQTFGGASSMDISMSSSRLWWGKQYGHFNVQEQTFGGASSMDILVSRMLVATVVRTDWQPPCMATYLGLMELKFLPMARCFRCLFLAISGTSVFKSPSKSAHTNPMNKTECREQLI